MKLLKHTKYVMAGILFSVTSHLAQAQVVNDTLMTNYIKKAHSLKHEHDSLRTDKEFEVLTMNVLEELQSAAWDSLKNNDPRGAAINLALIRELAVVSKDNDVKRQTEILGEALNETDWYLAVLSSEKMVSELLNVSKKELEAVLHEYLVSQFNAEMVMKKGDAHLRYTRQKQVHSIGGHKIHEFTDKELLRAIQEQAGHLSQEQQEVIFHDIKGH